MQVGWLAPSFTRRRQRPQVASVSSTDAVDRIQAGRAEHVDWWWGRSLRHPADCYWPANEDGPAAHIRAGCPWATHSPPSSAIALSHPRTSPFGSRSSSSHGSIRSTAARLSQRFARSLHRFLARPGSSSHGGSVPSRSWQARATRSATSSSPPKRQVEPAHFFDAKRDEDSFQAIACRSRTPCNRGAC